MLGYSYYFLTFHVIGIGRNPLQKQWIGKERNQAGFKTFELTKET
jgi:hypothetical protein